MEIVGKLTGVEVRVTWEGDTVSEGLSLKGNHRNTHGNKGTSTFGGKTHGIGGNEFDGKSWEYI